jgi:hypothetical protein
LFHKRPAIDPLVAAPLHHSYLLPFSLSGLRP